VRFSAVACCVLAATLVLPRITAPVSVKMTNARFAAGSKGTVPLPWTRIPKVGVSPELIWVVTLPPGGGRETLASLRIRLADEQRHRQGRPARAG